MVTSLPGTSSSVLSLCARQRHLSQPLKIISLYPDGALASRRGIDTAGGRPFVDGKNRIKIQDAILGEVKSFDIFSLGNSPDFD